MNKKPLPPVKSSNKQVQSYVTAVKRGQKSYHVVRSDAGWSVKRAGATRASGVYSTQNEAVIHGKNIARNNKTELFIHGANGRIRERNSYGPDPHPPKG